MSQAHIIDGISLAKKITDDLKKNIHNLNTKRPPGLATILVGNDPASGIYVANKRKKAEQVGIASFHHHLPESSTEEELIKLIMALNNDIKIDAILVQLPLPKHMNETHIIEAMDAQKDVDGIHPLNLGRLMRETPCTIPCTPLGIMHLIDSVGFDLQGKFAVVIGRSNIVGKPMAQLLLQRKATVTVCHSYTKDLAEITRHADLVVSAVGKASLITKNHIKKGAFVVDVGINRDAHNKLCGDVDFDDVVTIASYITKVPGGVGPLTIAILLKNTFANFLRTKQ